MSSEAKQEQMLQPWKVGDKPGDDELCVYNRRGELVATACTRYWGFVNGCSAARLIATGPELLGSCREWLGIWEYIKDNYPDIEIPLALRNGSDAAGRLRAAIAKAESE